MQRGPTYGNWDFGVGDSLDIEIWLLGHLHFKHSSFAFRHQQHREGAAATDFADDVHWAAILIQDRVRQRQTQTDAARFRRSERFTDARQVFRLNAAAGVGHRNLDLIRSLSGRERHTSALGRHRVTAVADQVGEDDR